MASKIERLIDLGGHLKAGKTWTRQNWPKDWRARQEVFTVRRPPRASRRDLSSVSCATALEHVAVVEETIEYHPDRGCVAKQLAPIFEESFENCELALEATGNVTHKGC